MATRGKARGRKRQKAGASSTKGIKSAELNVAQIADIKREYEEAKTRYQALMDEVVFILGEKIKNSSIKIHGIEQRIKSLESIIEKCQRKSAKDFKQLTDIVGARVVCLFRSDMDRVGNLLAENFEILEIDDKISAENGALGYLSVHYLCRMPDRYKGPRYEKTENLIFEIQVRTLCMHAWAAVSHYLDYKGDWDVPTELMRALSALSGLFYVADNEFEQFYSSRLASQAKAVDEVRRDAVQEINLDTVSAYLAARFAGRHDSGGMSELVQTIKEAGYTSMRQVESDIERALPAFLEFEKTTPPTDKDVYCSVGAARLSLGLASDKFLKIHLANDGIDLIEKYRALVPPVDHAH
jgi:putative GTP pyrophosphokinase